MSPSLAYIINFGLDLAVILTVAGVMRAIYRFLRQPDAPLPSHGGGTRPVLKPTPRRHGGRSHPARPHPTHAERHAPAAGR
jgi:hypothetical protein